MLWSLLRQACGRRKQFWPRPTLRIVPSTIRKKAGHCCHKQYLATFRRPLLKYSYFSMFLMQLCRRRVANQSTCLRGKHGESSGHERRTPKDRRRCCVRSVCYNCRCPLISDSMNSVFRCHPVQRPERRRVSGPVFEWLRCPNRKHIKGRASPYSRRSTCHR